MQAAITDFVGGLVRECHDLADSWRWRRPPGEEQGLARLQCWDILARSLPEHLDSPNGPRLDLDLASVRRMAGDSRALRHAASCRPTDADGVVAEIGRLYAATASRFDPPGAFLSPDSQQATRRWAEDHLSPQMDWARAAVSMLDFIRLSPLAANNVQIGALLAAALPFWAGQPLIHALDAETQTEDGFVHALSGGLEDDPGAWIAYVLAKQRRTLKRLPRLLEGVHTVRQGWVRLFRRAPFDTDVAEKLALEFSLLPVITPRFVEDTGSATGHLRDALVLLFAADQASEVTLANGEGMSILPTPLRLLASVRG